jgi:transcriptional regulator with GAF, ATPase, and Fis domain/tetratricopeptide (TPR) repeat protein
MRTSSQKLDFDNRLLSIEELFRQRKHDLAKRELGCLTEKDFSSSTLDLGLYLALYAYGCFIGGDYRTALKTGLRSRKILAGFPFNRRFGRVLLVLSKTYSAIGEMKNAEFRAHDSLSSYRRASEPLGQVDALNELARIAFIRGNFVDATQYLEEAIEQVAGDPRKSAQFTGNLGTVRVVCGQLIKAEIDLKKASEYHEEAGEEIALARNLLSLSCLHIYKREFVFAERTLERAQELINKHNLKREKIIALEYAGELAFEKGDTYKAKSLLSTAYREGRLLAPDSSLVTQVARRLADAELSLDNLDEAMKYGQKALELARQLGEKVEIAMSHRVIALIFAARGVKEDAKEHIRSAVEVIREVSDPLNTARILLSLAEIKMNSGSDEFDRIKAALDEAGRIFKKLRLDFWQAETNYRIGVFACQQGNLSRGFKKLSRSERVFISLGENTKVRRVSQFLVTLADQAVALSISQENEFKVIGNLITQSGLSDLRSEGLESIIQVLTMRTGADRAIIYTPDFEDSPVVASLELTPLQIRRFADSFQQLLGEEISRTSPTFLLDCRRDPYINDLLHDLPEVVASIIVIPFKMSDGSTSYVYIDKLSPDGFLNPFSQTELNFAVGFSDIIAFKSTELQKMKLQEDNRRLKAQLRESAAFPNILTCNSQMLEMLAQVRQVVESGISIAIEGETGSGKDLLAQAIHYNSSRRDNRFISVNCAALPETLLESELFGYRRGAFTGADRDKPGLIAEADCGTFFLDEVADMPLGIQAKLLRVLEDKEIVRLGDSVPRKVNVRIISATNKDLKEQMASGSFRSDLYYRLSALTFRLPPLRERKEDIPLLVNHFLEGSGKKVSPETMKALVAYDWHGNIRELDNEIKKMTLLAGDNDEIGKDVLSDKIGMSHGQQSLSPDPLLQMADTLSFGDEYSLYDYLAAHERRFIIMALRERKGVKKHAAAALNIPESTLRLKIKQYDINVDHLDSVN